MSILTTRFPLWQKKDHRKHWNSEKVLSTRYLVVLIAIICFHTSESTKICNYFSYSSQLGVTSSSFISLLFELNQFMLYGQHFKVVYVYVINILNALNDSAALTLNDLYDTTCMIQLVWLCKITNSYKLDAQILVWYNFWKIGRVLFLPTCMKEIN